MKVWNFNKENKVVVGNLEVENMEEARQLAREWNKECATTMQVHFVANWPILKEATKVSAIYS